MQHLPYYIFKRFHDRPLAELRTLWSGALQMCTVVCMPKAAELKIAELFVNQGWSKYYALLLRHNSRDAPIHCLSDSLQCLIKTVLIAICLFYYLQTAGIMMARLLPNRLTDLQCYWCRTTKWRFASFKRQHLISDIYTAFVKWVRET